MSGSGTGIGGREAAELRLEVVLRDGSTAAVYRLAPPWDRCAESSGGGAAAAATEATASLAAPAVPDQDLPTVARLVLTIVSAGATSSISFLPPGEKGEAAQGPSAMSLQILSASRAVLRTFDASGSQRKWCSTGLYTMCIEENYQSYSTEKLFGNVAVRFHALRCEELTFPPFKLKFARDFHVMKQLGKGTEGTVSKCSCNFSDYTCAIKEVTPARLLIRNTNSEPSDVSILAELNHPNIMKIHMAWNEKRIDYFSGLVDVTFVSMNLCQRTLSSYLKGNSTFELATANHIFRQIMMGLEYAHQHQVVHHDLKPDNILMDADLNIKISDFGIAVRKESPNSKLGAGMIGSFPYCAPEVTDFHRHHDERADVFPAGIIYFELHIPSAAQRYHKVRKISELTRKAISSWEPWTEFDLDSALEGTDILDDWAGDFPLLKLMLNPEEKRPSATDILARLPGTVAVDFEEN